MTSTEDPGLRLAGRLRTLRKAAGLSQQRLAEQMGVSQAFVTKTETGATTPSDDRDVLTWAKVTGADTDEVAFLLGLLSEARSLQTSWEVKFRRGQAVTQSEYERLARNASTIRNFETAAIPGVLQTAEYARHRVLEGQRQDADQSPAAIDEALSARVKRAAVLRDTSKVFVFLLAEPVLRWRLAPVDILRGQLAHLLTVSELPHVTLAVLPFAAQLADTPQHGFVMYDDLAIAETLTSEEVRGGKLGKKYADLFADFMSVAVSGDEARRLIVAAMRALD